MTTPTPGARRRFDGMIARAMHPGTPLAEAETALAGARSVLRKYPTIPRAVGRMESAERAVAVRAAGGSLADFADALDQFVDAMHDVTVVVRRDDGTYTRRAK